MHRVSMRRIFMLTSRKATIASGVPRAESKNCRRFNGLVVALDVRSWDEVVQIRTVPGRLALSRRANHEDAKGGSRFLEPGVVHGQVVAYFVVLEGQGHVRPRPAAKERDFHAVNLAVVAKVHLQRQGSERASPNLQPAEQKTGLRVKVELFGLAAARFRLDHPGASASDRFLSGH